MRSTDFGSARFVFSGAAVRTLVSEAQMMANYAMALGMPADNVVIEDKSTTTVENVVNSAGLLVDAPMVMVASNTFHARRARQVIRHESPELAGRLVRARDYIPFEWGLLHLVLVVFEAYRERHARAGAPT